MSTTAIATNIPSLTAQRNLYKSGGALTTAMQRLSSGLRINSAKDDAAGLAISNRMTAQIRGMNQAARNANDGVSLAQTAEGALEEITTNLQRIRELSVQSANATNSDVDRESLNAEVQELIKEIDRVAAQTQFNGAVLLDGSFTAQNFQVGANANQTIAVDVLGATAAQLGVSDAAAVASVMTTNAFVRGDLVINGVVVDGSFAKYDTASTNSASASAIAKAAAINAVKDQTGVEATVDTNVSEGAGMATPAAVSGAITVNGVATASVSTTTSAQASRALVVKAINDISSQTGVTARDTGDDLTGVELSAVDGRNIFVALGGTLTSITTGVKAGLNTGSFTLSSSKDIVIQRGDSTALETNVGLREGTYKTQVASVATVTNGGVAFASGDFKINGVLIGASQKQYDTASLAANAEKSGIAKAYAINMVADKTGVTATANENVYNGTTGMTASSLTGTLKINGVTTATFTTSGSDLSAARQATVNAINQIEGRTGVHAVDDGSNGVKLVAGDGRNITVSMTTITSAATGLVKTTATTGFGTFTLSSAKAITVEGGTTDMQTALTHTNLALGTYGTGKTGQSVDTIDISTFQGATDALAAIDNAIAQVSSNRATLGAMQNRFESAINSLQVGSENLSAARGRIRDADFAAETSNLSRAQILQQAGIAMVTQANAIAQNVLGLLRG